MKFLCPHCQGKTIIRTSQTVNALLRQITFQCQDPECSHSFMAWLEAYCSLSPSAKPAPHVYLPMNEGARRKVLEHPTLTSKWRQATVATPYVQDVAHEPVQSVQEALPAARPIPARDAITSALFAQSPAQVLRP